MNDIELTKAFIKMLGATMEEKLGHEFIGGRKLPSIGVRFFGNVGLGINFDADGNYDSHYTFKYIDKENANE